MKKEIVSKMLEPSSGPLSHAIQSGDFVFSTQVGFLPDGTMAGPGIYEQTLQTIQNMKYVLDELGATLEDVVKVTVYVLGLKENFADMNRAYREMMPSNPYPVRATVEVVDMVDEGALVEMEFIANVARR